MSTHPFQLLAATHLVSNALPLLVLSAVVLIVTTVALCRAEKEDIPQIFASFAAAFGFRKSGSIPVERPRATIEVQDVRPDEENA